MIKKIVVVLVLVLSIFLFQSYGVLDKMGRFVDIMGNIAYNLQHAKHAYEEFDFNISDKDIEDINVTKLASEFKSSIDKKKLLKAPLEIKADEIRDVVKKYGKVIERDIREDGF